MKNFTYHTKGSRRGYHLEQYFVPQWNFERASQHKFMVKHNSPIYDILHSTLPQNKTALALIHAFYIN